jgi:zinc D-Ala-D-Ala dipeptidase
VRGRLLRATRAFPTDIALCVFDGHRSLLVQQGLWDVFSAQVKTEHPDWSDAQIENHVKQFVAYPNPNPDRPPPHRTGGAVDVYLVSRTTGVPLPMGTEPDETDEKSVTDWYERHPIESNSFAHNRRLLYHAMIEAGFVNYPGEWWHYEYGTLRWALQKNKKMAIYGVAL